jgi:26S proteasome regulatory subunit N6
MLTGGGYEKEEGIKQHEQKIMEVGQELKDLGKADELKKLVSAIRPFLHLLSRAKAAKLVKDLIEMCIEMNAGTGFEVDLCKVHLLKTNTVVKSHFKLWQSLADGNI